MTIKKALKKEKFKRRRDIVLSLIIMIIMAYIVAVLAEKSILTGFDSYFSFFYVIVIDFLLLVNILRVLSEEKMSFNVSGDKLKIDGGYLSPNYVLPLNKIKYVDVHRVSDKEFNVLLVTKKAYRKKYRDFNSYFIRKNPHYINSLEYIQGTFNEDEKFSCVEVKKSGTRKYYLLYTLYKASYDIEFSRESIDYIKAFMKEYKL